MFYLPDLEDSSLHKFGHAWYYYQFILLCYHSHPFGLIGKILVLSFFLQVRVAGTTASATTINHLSVPNGLWIQPPESSTKC